MKHPNPEQMHNTVLSTVEKVAKDSLVKRLQATITVLKSNKPAWYITCATAISLMGTAIITVLDKAVDLYIKVCTFIH